MICDNYAQSCRWSSLISLLFKSFKVSVHEDEEDDRILFWKLVTDLVRLGLSFRMGLDILEFLVVGVILFGSSRSQLLCKVSKVFLMQVIFLSCASVMFFSNLPSPVGNKTKHA